MSSSVTQVPGSPPGTRLPRRSWKDPRLLAGVVLVVTSVTAVVVTVRTADDTTQVWAVRADVVAGTELTPEDVTAVPVRMPGLGPYVATSVPVAGSEVVRDLAAGELLTDAAVREPDEPRDARVVTVPVLRNQMPADLAAGDRVDVYLVERDGGGQPAGPPEQVLAAVLITSVADDGGAFGGTSLEVGVALSVPATDVPAVVDAQARGTLTLVDVPVGST